MSDPEKHPDDVRLARRALLKLGVWVTPAVIASFFLDRPALAASCGPQQCNPVNPGSCGPATGCGPGSGCSPVVGCNPSK